MTRMCFAVFRIADDDEFVELLRISMPREAETLCGRWFETHSPLLFLET